MEHSDGLTHKSRERLAFQVVAHVTREYDKGFGVMIGDLTHLNPKASLNDLADILETLARAGVLVEMHVAAVNKKNRVFTLSDGWIFERTLEAARKLANEIKKEGEVE